MSIFTKIEMQTHDAKHLKRAVDKLMNELGNHADLSSEEKQAFYELQEALLNADFE